MELMGRDRRGAFSGRLWMAPAGVVVTKCYRTLYCDFVLVHGFTEWGTPEYGTTDITSWLEYLVANDERRSVIQDNYTTDDTLLGGGDIVDDGGDWWPPIFWPSWLPSDPIGAAVVVLLGLAGFNVATS